MKLNIVRRKIVVYSRCLKVNFSFRSWSIKQIWPVEFWFWFMGSKYFQTYYSKLWSVIWCMISIRVHSPRFICNKKFWRQFSIFLNFFFLPFLEDDKLFDILSENNIEPQNWNTFPFCYYGIFVIQISRIRKTKCRDYGTEGGKVKNFFFRSLRNDELFPNTVLLQPVSILY